MVMMVSLFWSFASFVAGVGFETGLDGSLACWSFFAVGFFFPRRVGGEGFIRILSLARHRPLQTPVFLSLRLPARLLVRAGGLAQDFAPGDKIVLKRKEEGEWWLVKRAF